MAATDSNRTPEQIRRAIEEERRQLAHAVDALRADLGDATNIGGKLRAKLPLVAVGAAGLGFVAAGGIGATMRLVMRRSREGETKARLGRFSLVDRD
jgi:Protein of unknown function (DUF3618)